MNRKLVLAAASAVVAAALSPTAAMAWKRPPVIVTTCHQAHQGIHLLPYYVGPGCKQGTVYVAHTPPPRPPNR